MALIPAMVIVMFLLLFMILPEKTESVAERRSLQKFPVLSVSSMIDGSFMEEFEVYGMDHFPGRELFRKGKAAFCYYVLGQRAHHDIYLFNKSEIKIEADYDESSVAYATERFSYIYEKYLKDTQAKVYVSVIPDKHYFVTDTSGYPKMDYEKLFFDVEEQMPYASFIPIADTLKLSDYYLTDSHWKQECITPVAKRLLAGMGAAGEEISYDRVLATDDYYGVYYGQAALFSAADEIYYLTNDVIANSIVKDYETGKEIPVYDLEKLSGKDPYEMFLCGSRSFLEIQNPQAENGKELVLFRDSFGSSIAPLLLNGYEKITLIDIRYISPAMLSNFMNFDDQDVLFLYNTSVLNHSITIK